MSSNTSKRNRKNKLTLLSRPEVQRDFNSFRIKIKRHDIMASEPSRPLQRSLDDPTQLVIHRPGEGTKPIFDRDDVLCNEVDYDEDWRPQCASVEPTRMVYKSPTRNSNSPYRRETRSQSSDSGTSETSPQRHRSRDNRRTRSSSKSCDYRKGGYRKDSREREFPPLTAEYYRPKKGEIRRRSWSRTPPRKPGEYGRNGENRRSPDKFYSEHRHKNSGIRRSRSRSREYSSDKYRKYSRSPRRKHLDGPRRSPSGSRSRRYSDGRKRSASPRYEGSYKKERKHSVSPSRSHEIRKGSHDRYRGDSRSPHRHSYKRHDRYRSRSPNPPGKSFDRPSTSRRSRSPKSSNRRSRSPKHYSKGGDRSPHKIPAGYPPYFEAPEFWFPGPILPIRPMFPGNPYAHPVPGPRVMYHPGVRVMGYPPYRARLPNYNSHKTIIKKDNVATITSAPSEPTPTATGESTSSRNDSAGQESSSANKEDVTKKEDGSKENADETEDYQFN